jgi:hypothetical protein
MKVETKQTNRLEMVLLVIALLMFLLSVLAAFYK